MQLPVEGVSARHERTAETTGRQTAAAVWSTGAAALAAVTMRLVARLGSRVCLLGASRLDARLEQRTHRTRAAEEARLCGQKLKNRPHAPLAAAPTLETWYDCRGGTCGAVGAFGYH